MKYNASISVVGITDAQVQRALMKLAENSEYLKRELLKRENALRAEIMELRQIIAQGEKSKWQ